MERRGTGTSRENTLVFIDLALTGGEGALPTGWGRLEADQPDGAWKAKRIPAALHAFFEVRRGGGDA